MDSNITNIATKTEKDHEALFEARRLRIIEEENQSMIARKNAVKRRSLDVHATIDMLVKNKHFTKSRFEGYGKDIERLTYIVKHACVAKNVDGISELGTPINLNSIIDRSNWQRKGM